MLRILVAAALLLGISSASADDGARTSHALSLFGSPAEPEGFTHLSYVNPDAPKGGTVRLAVQGTFDSLNPFIVKGVPAAGASLVYDSLTWGSLDEPFSEYGLLAETITVADDNRWVEFKLREEARWHDGAPVTPDDVIWTFETLVTQGNPFYADYYRNVEAVEKTGPRTVRFRFSGATNRELALIVGQFDILPKHYWEGRNFEETTLEPPLGSGPYRFGQVDPGRSIAYERVPDYWGRDLALNRGRHNFDVLRYDYYRDANVMIEALKAGEYDYRLENISKEWATAYDLPEVDAGFLRKRLIPHELPSGMQGYGFNTRRPLFQDRELRRALALAFDFEWSNETLFYGQYARSESYFSNSELASSGLPDEAERALLEPYRGRIPDSVFTESYQAPSTEERSLRDNLRDARDILEAAGYRVEDGTLLTPADRPVRFEILLGAAAFERITGPFVNNLERLGVEATYRTVDRAQYINRLREFDYDMVVASFGQSLSPGNEQRNYWTSAAADTEGSFNLLGIRDPVVDELVDKVIHAADRSAQIAATRALDRVLLQGHYVIPHWHISSFRVVYWDIFGIPEQTPRYSTGFPSTWWYDAERAARIPNRAE